jgi:hypothetical protein
MADQKVSLLQHVYQDLRDAAMAWAKTEGMDENCAFNGPSLLNPKQAPNFWVQLARPSNIKGVVFRAAADRFMQQAEEDGLINDLLPVKFKITKSNSAYDIEGEEAAIGEAMDDFIVAYKMKVKEAVDNDPNWDMKIYAANQTPTALRIHLMHHTAAHHKKIVKNLTSIVNKICGPMDPVRATIEVKGPIATVHFKAAKLEESREQLLFHLLSEIVEGFRLSEETFFQDQGRRPFYSLSIQQGGGNQIIIMTLDADGSTPTGAFVKAVGRLEAYITEFLDEHILSPKFTKLRKVGRAEFVFNTSLKEELSPNDFALKIAHGIVKAIEDELKRKGAHNTATFEISQFNNGIPRIEATLNGRASLTRAAVERAMKDVVARELPDGNLLNLAGKFGGLGTAQGSKRILLAIKPIQPEPSAP